MRRSCVWDVPSLRAAARSESPAVCRRSLTERATALASGSGGSSCAATVVVSFDESRTRRWYRAALAAGTQDERTGGWIARRLVLRFSGERLDHIALVRVVREQDDAVTSGVARGADLIARSLGFAGVRHQSTPHPRRGRRGAGRAEHAPDFGGIGPVRHRAEEIDEPFGGPLGPALEHT